MFVITSYDSIFMEKLCLQSSFGVITYVRAKGKASVRVADILNRMQAEEPVNTPDVITATLSMLLSFNQCAS